MRHPNRLESIGSPTRFPSFPIQTNHFGQVGGGGVGEQERLCSAFGRRRRAVIELPLCFLPFFGSFSREGTSRCAEVCGCSSLNKVIASLKSAQERKASVCFVRNLEMLNEKDDYR